MELSNEFEVSVPLDDAWAVLTDLGRVASCLPGAQLDEIGDGEYRGTAEVTVGPTTARYAGKAHFVEQDEAEHRAVLIVSGVDTSGNGTASASITAFLAAVDGHTHVSLVTDLAITGRVAQFGRDVLAEGGATLVREFAENLEATIAERGVAPVSAGAPSTATVAAESARGAGDRVAEVDTLEPPRVEAPARASSAAVRGPSDDDGGASSLKRLVSSVVLGVVLALVVRSLRHRRA